MTNRTKKTATHIGWPAGNIPGSRHRTTYIMSIDAIIASYYYNYLPQFLQFWLHREP